MLIIMSFGMVETHIPENISCKIHGVMHYILVVMLKIAHYLSKIRIFLYIRDILNGKGHLLSLPIFVIYG